MEITSINVASMRANKIFRGATVFLFQHGRNLEHYVEEFLNIYHLATCNDICLMEGFRCGMVDLCFAIPRINFSLWTKGSLFTVGEAEDSSSLIQPPPTNVTQPDPVTTEMTTPESPADGELLRAASTEPLTTAPINTPEPKLQCESDQETRCEPATAVPEGILVEIDTGEDWLMEHCNTASHHTPDHLYAFSSSLLVLASLETESSSCIKFDLLSVDAQPSSPTSTI